MRLQTIRPEFVEFIPKELDQGVLYISDKYKVAVHKCASGCGEKVVTALSPADWQVRKKGGLVSLYPSIGNWNFACRSHYWIRENRIVWAGAMSDAEISRVQQRDRADKARQLRRVNATKENVHEPATLTDGSGPTPRPWWRRVVDFFAGQ